MLFNYHKYGESYMTHRTKQNHEEFCHGTPIDTYPYCLRILSISNIARHKRQCAQLNESRTGQEHKETCRTKGRTRNVVFVVN